ncbi:hypothetical protein [Paenibacillus sp. AGC30]
MSIASKILKDIRDNVIIYERNFGFAELKANIISGLKNQIQDSSVKHQLQEAEAYKDEYEKNAEDSYREALRLFDNYKDDFESEELKEAEELINRLKE